MGKWLSLDVLDKFVSIFIILFYSIYTSVNFFTFFHYEDDTYFTLAVANFSALVFYIIGRSYRSMWESTRKLNDSLFESFMKSSTNELETQIKLMKVIADKNTEILELKSELIKARSVITGEPNRVKGRPRKI